MQKCRMRIYLRNAGGYVDYEKYSIEIVDPTTPFPLDSFLIKYDYAIENRNGTLMWLNCVREYNGNEYPEFMGQEVYEKRGNVIWRR